MVAPEKVADLVVTDRDHISKIKAVIIAGRVVIEDGKPVDTVVHN